MHKLENTSYIFIPFLIQDQRDFPSLLSDLDQSSTWRVVQDKVTYMLKYVTDKIDSRDRDKCLYSHYELVPDAGNIIGPADPNEWYSTKAHKFLDGYAQFEFRILSVQLYCFNTSVCIMAFRLQFEKNDPLWISSAQYYLKKVSRERIYHKSAELFTFLSAAKDLMGELNQKYGTQFFYYANPSTERANFLTYLEVEPKEDYKRELFYLGHCYNEGFQYEGGSDSACMENYTASTATVWGITSEAAICLTCLEKGGREFIRNTFYRNFNEQYLFMYTFLLHQKYVLYMFMTQIGSETYDNAVMLEQYRNRLYRFENDFVFSCVTEVPQYQNLYERLSRAFSLKQMFEDVHEPLLSLSEVRREEDEKQQVRQEKRINIILFVLSLLTISSVLVDSLAFIEAFLGRFLNDNVLWPIQLGSVIAIGIILICVVVWLLTTRKK